MDKGSNISYSQHPIGRLFTGSPSPSPSLCNEPIFQTAIPDSGISRVQVKNPKIQFLNKTMVDVRRKKDDPQHGLNTPSRVEPSGMAYFFCGPESLSEFPDSGDGSVNGTQMSQISSFDMQCSQSERRSDQYPQIVHPMKSPQLSTALKDLKNRNTQWFRQPFLNLVSRNQVAVRNVMQNTSQRWGQQTLSAEERQIAAINLQTKTNVKNESKSCDKIKTSGKKKGPISMSRTIQKAVTRKRRKKIQRKNKSLSKTELCTFWTLTSTCAFEEKCYFAHGVDELRKRIRVGNFKTKPCVDCPREKTKCMFGSRCNYCHPGEAMRRTGGSTYYDVDYYKDLRKEFPNNEYPFGIFL